MAKKTRNNDEMYENIEDMEEYSKEQLITMAFLSSLMITDKLKKTEELKKILKIAKKLDVNLTGDLKLKKTRILRANSNEYELEDLVDNDIISEVDPRNILDIMASFASDIGFFDIQPEIEQLLQKYRNDLKNYGNSSIANMADKMKYSAKDNAEQYDGEQTKAETYANLAWLSNKLAHIFGEIDEKKIVGLPIDFRDAFMRIKNYSIHGIIAEKMEGRADGVLLGINNELRDDVRRNYEQYLFIGLPRYLQPILLHFHKNELSEQEREACKDKDDFSYNKTNDSVNIAIMPLKLSQEKEELLDYLYHDVYANRTHETNDMKKLQWYFEHNKTRNCLRKPKKLPTSKYTSPKCKVIEEKRENIDYISDLFSKINVELPDYMRNFFQSKANFSYEKFSPKVKMIIRDIMHKDGLTHDEINKQIDEIFAEVFISMCMLKPVTTISKQGTNNPKLIQSIEETMKNREVVIKFLRENAKAFDNYTEFKHSLKTELTDSLESKKSRDELAILQTRLEELNTTLKSKLEERQAVSEKETELRREIASLQKEIRSIEDEIGNQ